jgi:glycosyltransferase involved in cell wall biosynthesis
MRDNLNYSVIMAIKNGVNYLHDALESIYTQSLRPSEIIVIDDHSTDLTKETLRCDYPDVLVIDNTRHGQSAALNLGIKVAKFEILAFLDHDDLWTNNKQEIQLDILEQNEDFEVITSGVANFSEQGDLRDLGPARVFGASSFRKNVFSRYGYLDESISHHAIIDWWIRAESGGMNHSTHPEIGLMRRVHLTNSGTVNKSASRTDLFSILRKQISRVAENEV